MSDYVFPVVKVGDAVQFQPEQGSTEMDTMLVTHVDDQSLHGVVFATGHSGGIPKWGVRHVDDPWIAEHPEVIDEDGGVFLVGTTRQDLNYLTQAVSALATRLKALEEERDPVSA